MERQFCFDKVVKGGREVGERDALENVLYV